MGTTELFILGLFYIRFEFNHTLCDLKLIQNEYTETVVTWAADFYPTSLAVGRERLKIFWRRSWLMPELSQTALQNKFFLWCRTPAVVDACFGSRLMLPSSHKEESQSFSRGHFPYEIQSHRLVTEVANV